MSISHEIAFIDTPTGAVGWEKIDDDELEHEQWYALVPNVADSVINLVKEDDGRWSVRFDDEGEVFARAPKPNCGPHATREEAQAAADAWCAAWAPRLMSISRKRKIAIRRTCDESGNINGVAIAEYEEIDGLAFLGNEIDLTTGDLEILRRVLSMLQMEK